MLENEVITKSDDLHYEYQIIRHDGVFKKIKNNVSCLLGGYHKDCVCQI